MNNMRTKQFQILENDTGLDNVSDYLFWPELIDGLGKNANAETKIKKILERELPVESSTQQNWGWN